MNGGDGDRNEYGDQCRNQEEVPLQINVLAKVIKPATDHPIGQGPADHVGYQNKPKKFSGKECIDIGDGSSMYPPHADLLGFSFHHKGGEADDSETGNNNGQDGQDDG